MRIEDYQNDPNWTPSIGEKLTKTHYRNRHWHAECDPTTGICATHYDKHDPYESPTEFVKHVWGSNTGKALIICGVVAIGLAILKNR